MAQRPTEAEIDISRSRDAGRDVELYYGGAERGFVPAEGIDPDNYQEEFEYE